MWAKIAQSV